VTERTIERVEVFPLRLPVTRTFQFASGSAGTDSQGEIGWGEGRPHAAWAYETLESVTTTIRGYLAPTVEGLPISDRGGLHQRLRQAIGRGPSTGQPVAKAALDMAVHDLCARRSTRRASGQPTSSPTRPAAWPTTRIKRADLNQGIDSLADHC
jgi:muconate cycloisomerase